MKTFFLFITFLFAYTQLSAQFNNFEFNSSAGLSFFSYKDNALVSPHEKKSGSIGATTNYGISYTIAKSKFTNYKTGLYLTNHFTRILKQSGFSKVYHPFYFVNNNDTVILDGVSIKNKYISIPIQYLKVKKLTDKTHLEFGIGITNHILIHNNVILNVAAISQQPSITNLNLITEKYKAASRKMLISIEPIFNFNKKIFNSTYFHISTLPLIGYYTAGFLKDVATSSLVMTMKISIKKYF
jgi:hypothetical protein